VQVLGSPAEVAEAERLLSGALGTSWRERAEIRRTVLLPRGRAAVSAPAHRGRPGRSFGTCRLARAPVVRFDGRLTACCNEDVVTGHGPAALHATAREPEELRSALGVMAGAPFLAAITAAGPGALTDLPRYRELGVQDHPDICALCWALLDRGADRDPAVQAIGLAALGSADELAPRRSGGLLAPRRSP
jgi:hypothetical protein